MTPARTTTTYAILGLLSLQEWTTYELAKQVQRSLNWFWPRAERKLYDEPRRLVADGLASATAEKTGKRPRTVYAITDAGRAELGRWLGEPSAPRSTEFEAMVKVFFADAGTLSQLRSTVHAIAMESRDRFANLESLSTAVVATPPFPHRIQLNAITTRLQLEQELGVARWAAWALAQVDAWTSTGDPGDWDARAVLTEIAGTCRAASRSLPL